MWKIKPAKGFRPEIFYLKNLVMNKSKVYLLYNIFY